MNAVQYEEQIAKNLKLLKKLSEGLDKTKTEKEALEYIDRMSKEIGNVEAPEMPKVGKPKPLPAPIIPKKPTPITNSV